MLFSSVTFLYYFLPVVFAVYFSAPFLRRLLPLPKSSMAVHNGILLLASLVFYAWGEPKYVLIMLLSIAINYRAGLWVGETSYTVSTRRVILAIAITANLLLLFSNYK
jgi:alginate O-acetyltransferase complex protein AlgI